MLTFDIEWIAADRVVCPEHKATWARLCIRVDDQIVSEVLDKNTQSGREGLYLPLYPLAEWIATRWFPLLCEPEAAGRGDAEDFRRRHCVRVASEGFALPEFTIVSEGPQVRLEWKAVNIPSLGLRFVSLGEARDSRENLRDSLRQFLCRVVSRLDEMLPGVRTSLHEELQTIQDLHVEEADFCETAGRLGLDPFSLAEEDENKILETAQQLPEALHDEFFGVASFEALSDHLDWVKQGLNEAQSISGAADTLPSLRAFAGQSFPALSQTRPWEMGYECARKLRQYLSFNGAPLLDNDYDEKLGFACAKSRPNAKVNIDALSVRHPQNQLGSFVLSASLPASKRFAYARSLFEYLVSPDTKSLVSRAVTCAQQRNRAFAAELLAPAESIRERLFGGTVSQERIDELADEFSVSQYVIEHQIENHRLGKVLTPRKVVS